MKLRLNQLEAGLLVALGAGGLLLQDATCAVSFTVTPAVVSNTYAGVVTLNITGLTNHEQVTIQKYIDVNGNGVVDSGEPLLDAFKITDGGANIIGGITNINVPFDSNTNTGAITTSLSIAPPRSLENLVGQFIFRLSSPVQNFSPTNVTFTVTNSALGQSVSGVVYSNGAAPLPYAVVAVLKVAGGGKWAGGVVADSSGHYQLNLQPGSYMLMPALPGYYTDQSLAPQVTLTNGMSATNDLFLTSGTVTISGNVYDAGNGNKVGGVMMPAQGGNLFAISFTDTNGDYTTGVAPGSWQVGKPDGTQLALRACVVSQSNIQVDTSTGSVANVNLALSKANALFYGSFTNSSGVPMVNFGLEANDDAGQYEADGISDGSGNYCVAVLGGTSFWHCSPDNSDPTLASYLISSGSDTNLAVGQALLLNFVALPATARISGHVQDNLGNAVTGIGMADSSTIGGIQFSAYADTDASGNYQLPAASGVWNVNANCCGSEGLDSLGLTDPVMMHLVTVPPTNAVLNITVYPYGTPALIQPARFGVSGFAFGINGAPGMNYTIQACTNLTSTNWFTILVTNLSGNFLFIQDNQATNQQRFYRALLGP